MPQVPGTGGVNRRRGYLRLPRGELEHPALASSRRAFDYRSAWLWLVEHAAFGPTRTTVGGNRTIALTTGQLSHSSRYLATAWHWGDAAVRRFLERLARDGLIDAGTDAGQFLITIRDYERFRFSIETSDAASDAPPTQQRRSKRRSSDAASGAPSDAGPPPLTGGKNSTSSGIGPTSDAASDAPSGAEATQQRRSERRRESLNKESIKQGSRGEGETGSPCAEVARAWNEMAASVGLPTVLKLTDARRRLVTARLREVGGSVEQMCAILARVAASPVLRGERNSPEHQGWRADFDFIMSERAFTRLREGKYHDRENGAAAAGTAAAAKDDGPAPGFEPAIDPRAIAEYGDAAGLEPERLVPKR